MEKCQSIGKWLLASISNYQFTIEDTSPTHIISFIWYSLKKNELWRNLQFVHLKIIKYAGISLLKISMN